MAPKSCPNPATCTRRMDHHGKPLHGLLDGFKKPLAVRIIAINRHWLITPGREMMHGVGIFHSNWACHNTPEDTKSGRGCQVSRVDPNAPNALNALNARPDDKAATFTVELKAGRTTLQSWWHDAEGKKLAGAYYVTVRRR